MNINGIKHKLLFVSLLLHWIIIQQIENRERSGRIYWSHLLIDSKHVRPWTDVVNHCGSAKSSCSCSLNNNILWRGRVHHQRKQTAAPWYVPEQTVEQRGTWTPLFFILSSHTRTANSKIPLRFLPEKISRLSESSTTRKQFLVWWPVKVLKSCKRKKLSVN